MRQGSNWCQQNNNNTNICQASQGGLTAHCCAQCQEDATTLQAMAQDMVVDAFDSESAQVEVAKGSVVIYITFLADVLDSSAILEGLMRRGAPITFMRDPKRAFIYRATT